MNKKKEFTLEQRKDLQGNCEGTKNKHWYKYHQEYDYYYCIFCSKTVKG